MLEKFLQIADENPDGFTAKLSGELVTEGGFVVAEKETQNSFGIEGLKRVLEYAISHKTLVGGWKENESYYFDASRLYKNRDEAVKKGLENEQIAIYDLDRKEVVYL
jgi:hypothetical protein